MSSQVTFVALLQLAAMALSMTRARLFRPPTQGVRMMSGHSIEEAIGARPRTRARASGAHP